MKKIDKRIFQGISEEEKISLKINSRKNIAKISFGSTTAFVAIYLALYSTTSFYEENPKWFLSLGYALSFIFIVRVTSAFYILKKATNNTAWYILCIFIFFNGFFWGFFYISSFAIYGMSLSSLLLLLILVGLTSTTIASFKNNMILCHAFIAPMYITTTIFFAYTDIEVKYTLSLVFVFYYIYMSVIILQNYKEYWYRVVQNILLEKQKEKAETFQKQMFQASKLASLGELAAGVAHEINNPLMIISGNLDIFKENFEMFSNFEEKKSVEKAYNMVEESIQRISNIITELKTYARSDIKNDKPIDIHNAITNSIKLIKSIYSADNIKISVDLKADKSYVVGSFNKFQQVIMNLLSNSRDALSNTQNAQINISSSNIDNKLIITFSDNGLGINNEIMDKVFDSFFTTKDIGKGTGLGLSISYSIIQSMNGNIIVESEKEKGATFIMTFPLSSQQSSTIYS